MAKYLVGEYVSPVILKNIHNQDIEIPQPGWTHLQFRRFAACPICNLHVHEFSKRIDELANLKIQEVMVFHTSVEEMKQYSELSFQMIADPNKDLYRDFGVETSWLAFLYPASWWSGIKGLILFPGIPHNKGQGHFGLPADFLIASDGRIAAVKYGVHADDHWSVDELIDLVHKNKFAN